MGQRALRAMARVDGLGAKLAMVAVMSAVLLLPLWLVDRLVAERAGRSVDVAQSVAAAWGGRQTLIGPVLVIPYGDPGVAARKWIAVLPEKLAADAEIDPEVRRRGIFETVVYHSRIALSGRFPQPDFAALGVSPAEVRWSDAQVVVGIADLVGMQAIPELAWEGAPSEFQPGVGLGDFADKGLHAPVRLDRGAASYEFSTTLALRGSGGLAIAPVGKITQATMRGPWSHPSALGDFLPTVNEADKDGFSTKWEVPYVVRSYPQTWTSDAVGGAPTQRWSVEGGQGGYASPPSATGGLGDTLVGVDLVQPADLYDSVRRATKYGVLFVGLTLLSFFVFEATTEVRLHWSSYAQVGLAICLFFLMFLSFAEHIGVGPAYAVSASAVVALIVWYAASALRGRRRSVVVFALLAGLYAVLYTLLQLESFALLAGSLVLFAALAVTMFVTRRIDWSSMQTGSPPPSGTSPVAAAAGAE